MDIPCVIHRTAFQELQTGFILRSLIPQSLYQGHLIVNFLCNKFSGNWHGSAGKFILLFPQKGIALCTIIQSCNHAKIAGHQDDRKVKTFCLLD